MTLNMKDFLASINNEGIQHSNKFEVRIAPGPGAKVAREGIVLRCESVSMPGRTLNSITDANFFGPTREIVDGVTYAEDVTCAFIADGKFEIRKFFEEWQERAFNHTTWEVKYHNEYAGKVDIWLLDHHNHHSYGVTLHEAFPKTISSNELNMESMNEHQKISIGFSFRYWESYGGATRQAIIEGPAFDEFH